MAKLLCDRMQNLQFSPGGEPRFFHYCYICNTQLNSCKQALLHCSGKRHRKKLIFVQQRKNNLAAANQLPTHHDRPPMSPLFHSVSGYPVLQSGPPYLGPMGMATPESLGTPGMLVGHPVHHAASVPSFFPVINSNGVPMLSGNSTADWCHQQRSYLYSGSQQGGQFGLVPPAVPLGYGGSHLQQPRAPPPTLNFAGTSIPSAFALGFQYSSGSSSSSPMVMTDTSCGSGASDSCPSSAIISPSETSSITSEVMPRKMHKCQVCQRQCSTAAQLHSHLQNAKHYRPQHNSSDVTGEIGGIKSEPEEDVEDCAEAAAQKSVGRSLSQRINHSRSSSTSSEPADMIMDSGYTSGSGDEVIICVSPPTEEKPIAKFRCQLCNIFLNSPLQAKQHIASQRHRINLNVIGTFVPVDTNETSSVQNFTVVGRPSFRRRGVGSLRKRQTNTISCETQPSSPTTSSTASDPKTDECHAV